MEPPDNTQATTPEDVLRAVNELAEGVVERTGEQDQRLDQFEKRLNRATLPKEGYRVPDTEGGGADFDEPEQGDLIGFMRGQLSSLAEGTGSGSFLVPDHYLPQVWDMLAAQSVGLLSGFTTIDTNRAVVQLPRVLGDPDASWVAEGEQIPATDPDADIVEARVRKLAARTEATNEVLSDSDSALQVVFNGLTRALALKLDSGFYSGSGVAPEIKGLASYAEIQVIDQADVPLDNLDPFAVAIEALAVENATASAIVMHPAVWGTLMRIKELDTGSNVPLLQSSPGGGGIARSIYGVSVYLSSQLATDEPGDTTSAWVYQADQIVAVRREEARIEMDRSRLFDRDMAEIRGVLRYDLALPNIAAIARIGGIPVTAVT